MTTRPLDALDQQVDLIRWWQSPPGIRYAEHWVSAGHGLSLVDQHGNVTTAEDMPKAMSFTTRQGDPIVEPSVMGAIFADDAARALNRAETFVVADSMTEMILRASQSLDPTALRATDLPAPSGFVVFNRSIFETDVHRKTVSWKAAAWAPQNVTASNRSDESLNGEVGGVMLTFYTDTRDPFVREADNAIGELIADRYDIPRWLPLHTTAYGFGVPWDEPDWRDDANPPASAEVARRVMHAFWAISQQYVERTHRLPADRHLRRRIERSGLLTDVAKEVRVVTLRKIHEHVERDDDHEPMNVRWSHRWTVTGHWRNQWYPSQGVHRQVWIDEFEKGPEHLPLVVKDTVYKVTR